MSKFNNKKVEIDGIVFDSKMEGDYYEFLKRAKAQGAIQDFTLQPVYELQPKFTKRGLNFMAINYKSDFELTLNDGGLLTIDVKGFETADFKLKKKMFEYKYPQELRLITYSKIDGGWIEMNALKKARKIRKLQKEMSKLNPAFDKAKIAEINKKLDKLISS